MNRIVSSIKRYGGFSFSSSRLSLLSLIQSRPFSTSTDNHSPRKQQRDFKGGFSQRESDSEQKYAGNTSYNDRRFNDNKENRTTSDRYSDKIYNSRSFDESSRNRDRYEGERGDRNRQFTERKQRDNYDNHNSENGPTSDTYPKRNYNSNNENNSSNRDKRTISDRFSERRSGRVKFDEYSNRNRDRTTFDEKVFGDRVDHNHNNEGLMNALNEFKGAAFDEIIPSPLNLTLKFSIPPFNVEFPPIMTGDLLEFIQKREPTLLELTACFNTIDHAVNLRDVFGTEKKYFLRQTSFRIPACDKKIVSDNYKSQDEIHFKNKDFLRVLGLANELLKEKGEQDAYNVWENMSNSEKRDIQVVDIVDMLFPNGSITLSPSTPKNVDLVERVESYCSIGSVPWSIYLYATHIFLYRYSQYFRAKEAGIFRCRSAVKVRALVNDLSQLDDEKKLSEFVEICKSKVEEFARIDRQREQPNTSQIERTHTPTTPNTFWSVPKFVPFIQLLKWQALLTGYECSHPKIVSSLLLPIGIANDSRLIHAALVSLGAIEAHHNIFKLKAEFDAEIKFDFPKKLDKATNSLLSKFSSHVPTKINDGREDMRDHTIFTIDSLDTLEIDDGVSITDDGWFHVHIADPTKWFKPHSDLDIVARHRVTSIYLPEVKVSMLPLDVSKEVFSILPDRVGYALTFSIKLAEDGHIEDYKITPSIVQKIRKLDYFDVDCILENDYNPLSGLTDKEKNMIHRIYEGAVKHSEWRKSQGAVFVSLPEVKIELFDDGKQVKVGAINQNTKSRMLVSEMMLLCGQCASFFGIQNNVPLPYRFQTAPELSDEVKVFFKTLPENTLPFHRVRFLTGASVSPSPQRHYGVGVDSYVQASSPIRRYGDLLSHFQIKAFLRREDPPFSLSDMEKIIPLLVDVSKNIKDLQRVSNNFWTLRYLHQQGQQMYKALILGIEIDFGKISLFLIDVAYQLKVPIPSNLNITPGQYVLLQVLKVGLYHAHTRVVRVLEDNEV